MKFFSPKNIKFLFLLFILIISLFLLSRGRDNPVKGSVLYFTSPILKVSYGFSQGFEGFFEFLGSIGKLRDQNENLIKENQNLSAQNAKFGDIQKENEELRKELDLLPKNKYELEGMLVTAEDSLGAAGTILLDKGENYGIQEGMPVIIGNGIMIGKVSAVYQNSSRMSLITDRESAVNGEVLESGAKGIVRGTYGLGIMMDMLPQAEVIKEGDTVITSGLGGMTPRGLYLGKLGEVTQTEDKLFQQAAVLSPADFSSLRAVFVIKKF